MTLGNIPVGISLGLIAIGFLVGVTKTAIGGLGLLCAALIAQLLPTRESTAVLLILFICGDLFAISAYKRYVEWNFLRSLIWPVLFGIITGAYYLSQSSDQSLRWTIGCVVLLLVALYPVTQFWQRKHPNLDTAHPVYLRLGLGSMAGFMSMVANSGGTPMSIYLLLRRNSILNFLGNTAWFFFIVNLIKLPFALALGLLDIDSLTYLIPSIPMVALGAVAGRKLISHIDQEVFQIITLASAAVVGLKLILF